MIRIFTALAAMALASSASAQTEAQVDAIFGGLSEATPGCAVGIERRGQERLLRAYGAADLEHNAPITPETVFNVGSVSKQFTAAAILMLAEDGRLRLDDDVRKHVPELPDYGRPITLDHLLSHTSGVRDWFFLTGLAGQPTGSRTYSNAQLLKIVARQRALNFAPGTRYLYSTSNYLLLAVVAERVSGVSLPQFTRERIFEPLGMTSTRWQDDFRRLVPGRAIGYALGQEGWITNLPFTNDYGSGGLQSNVSDLLVWNRALTEARLGRYVTTEMQRVAHLTDGTAINYARGVFVVTDRGVQQVSHGGDTAGYHSFVARYPEVGASLVLLCNIISPALGSGREPFFDDALTDLVSGRPPAPTPEPSVTATAVAGTYANEDNGMLLRLSAEDGVLKQGGNTYAAVGPNTFRRGQAELTFGAGQVVATDRGEVRRYRRVGAYSPGARELSAFLGRFRSDELQTDYLTSTSDGALMVTIGDLPPVRLSPAYPDAFAGLPLGGIIRFVRDRRGRVVAMRVDTPRAWNLRLARIAAGGGQ